MRATAYGCAFAGQRCTVDGFAVLDGVLIAWVTFDKYPNIQIAVPLSCLQPLSILDYEDSLN